MHGNTGSTAVARANARWFSTHRPPRADFQLALPDPTKPVAIKITVPTGLKIEAKIRTIDEKITLSAFIERAIRHELERAS